MKYAKPYSRSFEAANVEVEDGPLALEVIEALLVFAQRDAGYVLQLREQIEPLRAAIDSGDTKPIARAILATIRSVCRVDRSDTTTWIYDIRRYWEAVETAGDCLRGLDAVLTLCRGHGTPRDHCRDIIGRAQTHRDAVAAAAGRDPVQEVRAARAWAKRDAAHIEEAAMRYWSSQGAPLAPDWVVLGDPRPPARTLRHSSPKFPLPWED